MCVASHTCHSASYACRSTLLKGSFAKETYNSFAKETYNSFAKETYKVTHVKCKVAL